jgi:hypothetical protein
MSFNARRSPTGNVEGSGERNLRPFILSHPASSTAQVPSLKAPCHSAADGTRTALSPSGSGGARATTILTSLDSERSLLIDAEYATSFLAAVHTAFPTANLEGFRDGLSETRGATTRLRREFKESDARWREAFTAAREDFAVTTLRPGAALRPPRDPKLAVNFSPDAKYAKPSYEKVEADFLVKVPFHGTSDSVAWTREPAADEATGLFFIAPAENSQQQLTRMAAPTRTSPRRRSPHDGAAAAAAPSLGSTSSLDTSTHSAGSTNTATHYPPEASHYIVGEAYAPHRDAAVGTVTTAVQKLLQLERLLRFLVVKEGSKAVTDCVLGAVSLGSHLSEVVRGKLFVTLKHYQMALPLLWELQCAGRLLAWLPASALLPVVVYRQQLALERVDEQLVTLQERMGGPAGGSGGPTCRPGGPAGPNE